MKSNIESAVVFDLGSLYAELSKLSDRRAAREIRDQLDNLMAFMLIAKLCGEDRPSGIAEWVLHRIDLLTTALQIERKSARITAPIVGS
jgi:hypothetical protein